MSRYRQFLYRHIQGIYGTQWANESFVLFLQGLASGDRQMQNLHGNAIRYELSR